MNSDFDIKLVLGNDFDLFCELKTKYIDFFENEKEKYDEIKNWRCSFIKKEDILYHYVGGKVYNWKDLWLPLSNEFNIWDLFFALGIGEEDYKWCDIETSMLNTFINKDLNLSWDNVYLIFMSRNPDYKRSNLELLMVAYIINKNINILSENDFYSFLLCELNKFEKNFGLYVKNEYEKNYNDKVLINVSKFLDCISDEVYNKIRSVETFNYTDNSNKKAYVWKNINNINGDYNNPIFGIDSNEVDVKSPKFLFTKVARRMLNLMEKKGNMFKTFERDFDTLIIFGHSLNEHDYNYFFPIFDYLDITNITKTTTLIFYYYIYDEEKRNLILQDQISKITQIIDAYEGYAGVKKTHRLIDSLTAQGRIILKEITK